VQYRSRDRVELDLYSPLHLEHARDNSTIPLFVFISFVIILSRAPLRHTCQSLYSLLQQWRYMAAISAGECTVHTTDCSYCCTTNSRLRWPNCTFIRNVSNYLQNYLSLHHSEIEASWNVMAHAPKPNFVFRRNGRVHLNQRGRQFSRLLAAEVCASAVVMLDTPCSEVVWRLPTPLASFPFISPTMRHRVPPYFNWSLLLIRLALQFYSHRAKSQVSATWNGLANHFQTTGYRGLLLCCFHATDLWH